MAIGVLLDFPGATLAQYDQEKIGPITQSVGMTAPPDAVLRRAQLPHRRQLRIPGSKSRAPVGAETQSLVLPPSPG
jgi:hypothetical protein